jgi:TPR repeat protein
MGNYQTVTDVARNRVALLVKYVDTNSQPAPEHSPSSLTTTTDETDISIQTALVGRWAMVAHEGQGHVSADKVEITFLPENRLAADSTQNGKVYSERGKYSVKGPTLTIIDDQDSRPDALDFCLIGNYLIINQFAQYGIDIVLRRTDGLNGQFTTSELQRLVADIRVKAEKGDPQSQYQLGHAFSAGRLGLAKDEAEAVRWFRKAAEENHALAQFNLAVCYENGQGVAKDEVEAVKWYRKAAEQDYPFAQFILGSRYENGHGVAKDCVEAVNWYRKAAVQNCAEAQCCLGVCYESGQGVVKDYVEAVKWLRKAAEQGYVLAQNNLGVCYAKGQGVVKDETEAVKWYRKAAEQNLAEAQYSLGNWYALGQGVVKDEAEAVKWFRKAAEQNYAKAQCVLGVAYYGGQGVAKDEVEAVKWFRKAAAQNCAEAQWLLGICYAKGQGVARDEAEAVTWYRKAAECGEINALNSLAWILATSANSSIRDGSNAVVFAEKAVAATNRKDPAALDNLAAAFAEAGQFEKAVSTEKEAIALLRTEAEKNDYTTRLKLFEAKLPYRAKD